MKQRVIIMGATSGIGLEVARLLHKDGYSIGIAGRRLEKLLSISAELNNCPYAQIDIIDPEAPEQLQNLVESLGGMDIYIHVSGIGKQNRQLDTSIELATLDTNVMGFTRMINYALHYFKKKGNGHIAAVTSIAGTMGMGAAPSYSASKRYCNTYLQALAQMAYMQGLNIAFTDIRPGFVDTDLLSKDFHYPMLMNPRKVSRMIVDGIKKRKRVITIDWRYHILVTLWKMIPSCLWKRMRIG